MKIFRSKDSLLNVLWLNRELINASVRREVLGRYKGSYFGVLWSFFNPLLMLIVYTFVFGIVFKARWGGEESSNGEFALVLFAGLIFFNLFAECINRAPSLILSNPNYVKKVIYPLEILPVISLYSALYHLVLSIMIWLVGYVVLFGLPHLTIIYLPLLLIPYCLLILGISWGLASLGVYLRDVTQVVGVCTTILLFLSPVFYPATALPEQYRFLVYINPLTYIIENSRNAMCWGLVPNMFELALYSIASLAVCLIGFAWFKKTKKGFADVI